MKTSQLTSQLTKRFGGFVVACCRRDLWLARICVASIRDQYQDVPITLLRDQFNGCFSTRELERTFGCRVRDAHIPGWGLSKLSVFDWGGSERYILLDADTVVLGPLVDRLLADDAPVVVSPDFRAVNDKLVHDHYLDVTALKAYFPDYHYPGYVFNTGQLVVSPCQEIADRVKQLQQMLGSLNILRCADQGILNAALAPGLRPSSVSLALVPFKINARAPSALDRFAKHAAVGLTPGEACVVHWMGPKGTTLRSFSASTILQYFEGKYYGTSLVAKARREGRSVMRFATEKSACVGALVRRAGAKAGRFVCRQRSRAD